jgi:hypothetical protein
MLSIDGNITDNYQVISNSPNNTSLYMKKLETIYIIIIPIVIIVIP